MKVFTDALWVFAIFSFFGWLGQFLYRVVKERKLVDPGFITLPFSVSAGTIAVMLFLAFYKVENDFIIFFGSTFMFILYKYVYSFVFERMFGFKWKDYSKTKLNLNGYVGLWEAIIFGVFSAIFLNWVIEPIRDLSGAMPQWLSLLIPSIITGLAIADLLISIYVVLHLRRNLKRMKNISQLLEDNNEGVDNTQLREEYERKLVMNKAFRKRLVNAFPDMQAVNYEKQLDEIKVRLEVVREKNDEEYEKSPLKAQDTPFAYGLNFSKLFWLFLIGSAFGTLLETIWAFFTIGHFEMRVGLVLGPFIPVYGGGAVMITLCLYRLHKAGDLIIYLSSAIIGATFEYLCSYFQEMILGTVSWDYSDTPFNIDGRTNLMFALIWGLLGLTWLRYVYPTISRWIEKIPKKVGRILTIILVIFMIIDAILSVMAVYRQNQRSEGIKPKTVIGEMIDECFNDDYMNFVFPHMAKPEDWGKQ